MTIDITNMSNRQIEEVIQQGLVELQDRQYRIYEDAITHHIYVGEVEEKYREGYLEYLEEANQSPASQDILAEWYSQQDIIQSHKTTGA